MRKGYYVCLGEMAGVERREVGCKIMKSTSIIKESKYKCLKLIKQERAVYQLEIWKLAAKINS